MPDDPHVDNEAIDSQALEEWVEKTAETKGISRGEVLDQMLSSYWILEELTGMMDEAKAEGELRGTETESKNEMNGGSKTPSGSTTNSADEEDGLFPDGDFSDLISEFQELRTAILESQERQHQFQGSDRSPTGGRRTDRQSIPSVTDGRLEYAISDLRDRIRTLSDRIEEVESGHEEDIEELETDVEETITLLDELEEGIEEDLATKSELRTVRDDVGDRVSRLDENMTEVLGNVSQIEESVQELGAKVSTLDETTTELDRRMEREFDGIERVFEHLLSTTEDIEYRLGGLSESHQEDIEPILEFVENQDRLDTLTKAANRKGISKAECDNCDSTVNIGLLNEPFCPGCDRPFSGLEKGAKWNPLSSHTIRTEPMSPSSNERIEDADAEGDSREPSPRMDRSDNP